MIKSHVLGPKTGPERWAGYQTNIPPTTGYGGTDDETLWIPSCVRERLRSRVVRRDEHWDRPYVQGTSQPRAISESSESAAQAALQGLTCD